jgi:hypothetical protein
MVFFENEKIILKVTVAAKTKEDRIARRNKTALVRYLFKKLTV